MQLTKHHYSYYNFIANNYYSQHDYYKNWNHLHLQHIPIKSASNYLYFIIKQNFNLRRPQPSLDHDYAIFLIIPFLMYYSQINLN